MKQIEKLGKIQLLVVVLIALGIMAWGVTTTFNTFTSGNFFETPGVTWKDISQESRFTNVLVVVYKDDSDKSKALKPAIDRAKQQNISDEPIKVVYVNAKSKAGKEITPMLPIDSNDLPELIPVKAGVTRVKVKSEDGTYVAFPKSATQLVRKNTDPKTKTKYVANQQIVDQYFAGQWFQD